MFSPEVDNITKITDATIKGVQTLADKLSVTSGQLWSVLVAQGWLELTKSLGVIVGIPLALAWFYNSIKDDMFRRNRWDESFPTHKGWFFFIAVLVGGIMFISALCGIQTPQMFAVEQIMNVIK